MRSECDEVRAAIAEGAPLPAAQAAHLTRCDACAQAVRLKASVQAALAERPRPAADDAFATRVAAKARARAEERRRASLGVVGLAAGVGVAAAALLAWQALGGDAERVERVERRERAPATATPVADDGAEGDVPSAETAGQLVMLSDVDLALGFRARWEWIEEPIESANVLLWEDLR
jgi:anti-sigma factor RsiW